MKESIDIYCRVGQHCPAFYPDLSSSRSCPDVSRANCRNCRNFSLSRKICMIDMFDKVLDGIFAANSRRYEG